MGSADAFNDDAASPGGARISFFVGKGGVGKSTLASATAVQAALGGQRVLVVSTDQAHSLGDVLGVPVTPGGAAAVPVRILTEERGGVGGGGHLDAMALDTLALLESAWRIAGPVLAARFPESDLKDVAPQELLTLPGIQEVLGLQAVASLADSGRWDRVVVDCASTADAVRMLTLPAVFADYLERCWPRHRRLSSDSHDVPLAATVVMIETLGASLEALSGLLTNEARVSAHLVLTPERVVAAEALRTLGSLTLLGVAVAEVIVNQVLLQDDSFEYRNLPEHPAFDWYASRLSEQGEVLERLAGQTGGIRLVLAPHCPAEPIGAKALGQLLDDARRREGAAPPPPLRPVVERETGPGGRSLDAVYRLRLELTQADSSAISLGRSGDDLIIAVAGVRRRIRLAPVLRRCMVLDATLRGGELTVRFRPDPQVWPS